jgi:hypothetical protein
VVHSRTVCHCTPVVLQYRDPIQVTRKLDELLSIPAVFRLVRPQCSDQTLSHNSTCRQRSSCRPTIFHSASHHPQRRSPQRYRDECPPATMGLVGGRRPQGWHHQNSIWVLYGRSLLHQSRKERISLRLAIKMYLFLTSGQRSASFSHSLTSVRPGQRNSFSSVSGGPLPHWISL